MPPFGRPRPDKPAVDAFVARLERDARRRGGRAPEPGPAGHAPAEPNRNTPTRSAISSRSKSTRAAAAGRRHRPARVRQQRRVLSLSPALLERYLSAARKITRLAVGRPPSAAAIETYTLPGLLVQDDRADERLPFGSRGGAVIEHHFPADGEYTITIHLQKTSTTTSAAWPIRTNSRFAAGP